MRHEADRGETAAEITPQSRLVVVEARQRSLGFLIDAASADRQAPVELVPRSEKAYPMEMNPSPETASGDYVPLDLYLSLAEADLMRSMLEAAGLEAQVRDEYVAGLSWYYIPAMGGVRLEVPADQWEEAQELLAAEPEPIEQTEEEETYLED